MTEQLALDFTGWIELVSPTYTFPEPEFPEPEIDEQETAE